MANLTLTDTAKTLDRTPTAALPSTADTQRWLAGTPFVLAPPPAKTIPGEPATASPVRRRVTRPRLRWDEIGIALLTLASGAIAVYRLLWMGQ